MPTLSSATGPAVASVRTQTASTGAVRGRSHVKTNSTWSASFREVDGGVVDLRVIDDECTGVVKPSDAGATYVAQVTRWMIQQTRNATCQGTIIATSKQMRNIERTP
jgi:hypothetical protein